MHWGFKMTPSDEKLLNELFEDARSEVVVPSDDFMARILSDADQLQPVVTPIRIPPETVWSRIMSAVGGWPALSGVAAAGVAGLWIGLTPPDSVDSWMAGMVGSTTSISFGDDFTIFEEGAFDG